MTLVVCCTVLDAGLGGGAVEAPLDSARSGASVTSNTSGQTAFVQVLLIDGVKQESLQLGTVLFRLPITETSGSYVLYITDPDQISDMRKGSKNLAVVTIHRGSANEDGHAPSHALEVDGDGQFVGRFFDEFPLGGTAAAFETTSHIAQRVVHRVTEISLECCIQTVVYECGRQYQMLTPAESLEFHTSLVSLHTILMREDFRRNIFTPQKEMLSMQVETAVQDLVNAEVKHAQQLEEKEIEIVQLHRLLLETPSQSHNASPQQPEPAAKKPIGSSSPVRTPRLSEIARAVEPIKKKLQVKEAEVNHLRERVKELEHQQSLALQEAKEQQKIPPRPVPFGRNPSGVGPRVAARSPNPRVPSADKQRFKSPAVAANGSPSGPHTADSKKAERIHRIDEAVKKLQETEGDKKPQPSQTGHYRVRDLSPVRIVTNVQELAREKDEKAKAAAQKFKRTGISPMKRSRVPSPKNAVQSPPNQATTGSDGATAATATASLRHHPSPLHSTKCVRVVVGPSLRKPSPAARKHNTV